MLRRRMDPDKNADPSLYGRGKRWGAPARSIKAGRGRDPPEGSPGPVDREPPARPANGFRPWQALATEYGSTRVLYEIGEALANPLTPMKLQIHLLRKGYLGPINEEQAFSLGVLARNLERMVAVLADILDGAGDGNGTRAKPRAASTW